MISEPQQPRRKRVFKSLLEDILPDIKQESLRICIASPEIIGPKHGGIATAYYNLAITLAKAGNQITILFAPSDQHPSTAVDQWIKTYRAIGISLIVLDATKENQLRSLSVKEWFEKNKTFNIIHFPEWGGIGFHTLLSHYEGLFLPDACIVVGVHGSTRWLKTFNDNNIVRSIKDLELFFIEEESIRLADVVISPSLYYLEWLEKNEVALPANSFFMPNILPLSEESSNEQMESKKQNFNEIIFFGRLEPRKGLFLFCNSIDHSDLRNNPDITLTFIGHNRLIDGVPSDDYIRTRARFWKNKIKIFTNFTRDESLKYLSSHECLAVIASLSETMSYTVLECLGERIPFIASRVGGIPELIRPEDRDCILFDPHPEALSQLLDRVINSSNPIAKPAQPFQMVQKGWIDWHNGNLSSTNRSSNQGDSALTKCKLSVCLQLEYLDDSLMGVLKSLSAQTCPPEEVIVTISDSAFEKDGRRFLLTDYLNQNGWTLLIQSNHSPEVSFRNAGRTATGDGLVYLDGKTLPFPNMLCVIQSVLNKTDADILSCSLLESLGQEEKQKNFLGGAIGPGFFQNVFGKGIFFITRKVFNVIDPLLAEIRSETPEWGILANTVLLGFRLETIPVPLARSLDLPNINPNILPTDHPYFPNIPKNMKDIALTLYGARNFLEKRADGSYLHSPQTIVLDYIHSRSFETARKIFSPIEKFFGKGIAGNLKHEVRTLGEAIDVLNDLHSTPTGILAGILFRIQKIRNKLK